MPPELANKIAAGEVVERPASVVRELLDNAIDAGATEIHVSVEKAGRQLIQVVDDGAGMGMEDLPLCFEQHATSKVKRVEDLFRISTLGFRGEAMASIASIADVEVKSRRHEEDSGVYYHIEGGVERALEPAPVPPGTRVLVRRLFYNVPARRQFLKTDATELRHIVRSTQAAALAHPDIRFSLESDGERLWDLPAGDLRDRVVHLYGSTYRQSLIPFQEKTSTLEIHGFLSDPALAKRSRGEQFLFVNGRPVRHRYLTHLILSLYEKATGERSYPFFALFLQTDPSRVDVNVHPAKLEVKFNDEKSVVQLTRSVLKHALFHYLNVPDQSEEPIRSELNRAFRPGQLEGVIRERERTHGGDAGTMQFSNGGSPDRILSPTDDERANVEFPSRINFLESKENGSGMTGQTQGRSEQMQEDERIDSSRVFWQLHQRYILSQTRSGLCIVHQKRAHMRILFEKALLATEMAIPGTQQLLFSQTIQLSASDFVLLKELAPLMNQMGFSIQLMSGHTVMVQGVPSDIDVGDEQRVVPQILQSYRELDRAIDLDARRKVAAAFASRASIDVGRRLEEEEMEHLMDQLFACEEPYEDPFGKKTLYYLSMDDVARRFGTP
ncbi:MAG: DNA mismatch repair endonuclease MutL [Balneolaceae bacterium]